MDAAVRRKETESEDCESHQLLGWTRRCVQAVFERAWARMKYAIVIDRGQWKWLTKTAELSITATALENGADFRLSHASHRTTRSFIRSRTHIHTPHEFLSWIPRKCAFRCAQQLHSPNCDFPISRRRPSIRLEKLRARVASTLAESSFSATRRMQTHSVENRLSRRTERKIIFFRTSVSHKGNFCQKKRVFHFISFGVSFVLMTLCALFAVNKFYDRPSPQFRVKKK